MATPLEAGQTTLVATLNGALITSRPPPRPRQGPKDQLNSKLCSLFKLPISCLPRSEEQIRKLGGVNEQRVRQMFAQFRRDHDDPDDPAEQDNDSTVPDRLLKDYKPRKRHSYPWEYKLAAIEYFQTTWVDVLDLPKERISVRRAARRLKIDRKSLKNWVLNKQKIINQPKGSRRASRASNSKGRFHELKLQLYNQFLEARTSGRKVDDKWILRHAKAIFQEMYP
jgi:hypothetical protein